MQYALPALHVLYTQAADLAADAMVEQGGQDGAIANTLEGIVGWRIEKQRLNLPIEIICARLGDYAVGRGNSGIRYSSVTLVAQG
jgi:hypothetical protein